MGRRLLSSGPTIPACVKSLPRFAPDRYGTTIDPASPITPGTADGNPWVSVKRCGGGLVKKKGAGYALLRDKILVNTGDARCSAAAIASIESDSSRPPPVPRHRLRVTAEPGEKPPVSRQKSHCQKGS